MSTSAKQLAARVSPESAVQWAEVAHCATQFYISRWKKAFATDANMLKLLLMLIGGLAQHHDVQRATFWADKVIAASLEVCMCT